MATQAAGGGLEALLAAARGARGKCESGVTPSVRAASAAMKRSATTFCDCVGVGDDVIWIGRGNDEVQALGSAARSAGSVS